MSGSIDPKAERVRRVLGVTIIRPAPAADWRTARAGWQDATEKVDGQIAALVAAMRASNDDVMEDIADRGMNALTANHKVKLMAALMDIGSGDSASMRKSGPKALAIARQFSSHIETDERIAACEDNPFGVPLAIRATLGRDEFERKLQRMGLTKEAFGQDHGDLGVGDALAIAEYSGGFYTHINSLLVGKSIKDTGDGALTKRAKKIAELTQEAMKKLQAYRGIRRNRAGGFRRNAVRPTGPALRHNTSLAMSSRSRFSGVLG